MRETSADKSAHAEIEISIMAHRLFENLVVRPESRPKVTGKFAVIAGGRRLKALNSITAAGSLAKNRPIPCLVMDKDDASEYSLAENILRVGMHPTDQLVSFAKLVQEGTTVT